MFQDDASRIDKDQGLDFVSPSDLNNVVLLNKPIFRIESKGDEPIEPEDPSLELVYSKAMQVLKTQENLKGTAKDQVDGVTLSELQDITGLGYSVVRDRALTLVEQHRLVCEEGRGRRPAYFYLPGQFALTQNIGETTVKDEELSDEIFITFLNRKKDLLSIQLNEITQEIEIITKSIALKQKLKKEVLSAQIKQENNNNVDRLD